MSGISNPPSAGSPTDDEPMPDFIWKIYQEGLEAGFQEAHNKTSKDAGQVKQEAWAALTTYINKYYIRKDEA